MSLTAPLTTKQPQKGLFNRGLLMNIGFLFAREYFDYFAFHDVDMVSARTR
jgi:hypothetical protein